MVDKAHSKGAGPSPEMDEILNLQPPEGWIIPIPRDRKPKNYRATIRNQVDRWVCPHSPFRYRISVTAAGEILVACRP